MWGFGNQIRFEGGPSKRRLKYVGRVVKTGLGYLAGTVA